MFAYACTVFFGFFSSLAFIVKQHVHFLDLHKLSYDSGIFNIIVFTVDVVPL